MKNVTVVIPVRNEQANLPRCLAALKRFDNIVVVDSGSTDNTQQIARDAGAKILDFQWNGTFPKKRNWVLMNHTPDTPWVLFLDADEIVSDEFVNALENAIQDDSKAGYWLNYTLYFQGKRLQHGVPQRKLALFRVGSGLFEKIDEDGWSKLDMEIHEHPIIEGEIGEISAEIDHQDYRGLARFIERHLDYAKWEAKRVALLGDLNAPENASLTRRQKFKYGNFDRWWYASVYFVYQYIVKRGLFDGRAGYHYAYYKAWYFRTIRQLILEQRNEGRQ
ncbi:MAG: glycosyltransferase family 2 protein [Pseudomonadota bacterium]